MEGRKKESVKRVYPKTSPRPFGLGLTRRIQQILSTKASSRHFHSSVFKATSRQQGSQDNRFTSFEVVLDSARDHRAASIRACVWTICHPLFGLSLQQRSTSSSDNVSPNPLVRFWLEARPVTMLTCAYTRPKSLELVQLFASVIEIRSVASYAVQL